MSRAMGIAAVKTNGRCYYCGVKLQQHKGHGKVPPNAAAVEHMVPKSRGGTGKADNITAACWTCNASKGTKTIDEYRRWFAYKNVMPEDAPNLTLDQIDWIVANTTGSVFDSCGPGPTFYGETLDNEY